LAPIGSINPLASVVGSHHFEFGVHLDHFRVGAQNYRRLARFFLGFGRFILSTRATCFLGGKPLFLIFFEFLIQQRNVGRLLDRLQHHRFALWYDVDGRYFLNNRFLRVERRKGVQALKR
jgi:hypothetical protein